MAERTQRYTEAERAQQRANTRRRYQLYGYGATERNLGLENVPEKGKHALAIDAENAKYGRFLTSFQRRINPATGQLEFKPYGNQAGRIAAGGGGWQVAPDYAQRDAQLMGRTAGDTLAAKLAKIGIGKHVAQWREQGYNATPDQYGLITGPHGGQWVAATGLRALGGGTPYYEGAHGQQYAGTAVAGARPRGVPNPMAGGAAPTGGYGTQQGYGQGYIPGYAAPFNLPSYSMPGYFGSSWGAYQNQAPSTLNYRTLQQQGGSTFGSYPPAGGFAPMPSGYQGYQPSWMGSIRT